VFWMEQAQAARRLTHVTSKSDEMTRWLNEYENKQLADVDALVYPKDTWSAQLLDAVAEDAAITDTLFVLDRAIVAERIDLRTFLKQVRKLATQQFEARALAFAIQKQIQLQGPPKSFLIQ